MGKMKKEYLDNFDDFKDMSVWQIARKISKNIFKITRKLPREEDYGLTSQIRRSANSIGANIAEGYGRKKKKEKVQFYTYSISSAYETLHHLRYGTDVGYFNESDVRNTSKLIKKIIYELNKFNKTIDIRWS
jgi:four helix bundle protein